MTLLCQKGQLISFPSSLGFLVISSLFISVWAQYVHASQDQVPAQQHAEARISPELSVLSLSPLMPLQNPMLSLC